MRTTLSLDDDVAAQLERLRAQGNQTFKDLVNDALRAGLASMERGERRSRGPFTHPAESVGQPKLPNVDDISEVLRIIEGEDYK